MEHSSLPGYGLTREERRRVLHKARRNVRKAAPGLSPRAFRYRVDREIERLARDVLRQKADTNMQADRQCSRTGDGNMAGKGSAAFRAPAQRQPRRQRGGRKRR